MCVKVFFVVGVTQATANFQAIINSVADRAKRSPRFGVLILNRIAILWITWCQRVVVIAINFNVFFEEEQATDPLQWIFGIGLQAEFLSDLSQVWCAVCCFRWEWNGAERT